MNDWLSEFKSFNESLGHAAKNVVNFIDIWSFKAVVDNLKSDDFDVVSSAIDQIVKEKRPLGIPPLFFVSRAHPNTFARKRASEALLQLGVDEEIDKLTQGKSAGEATRILIEHYGNYKAP